MMFAEWWNEPVLVIQGGGSLSRRLLVLNLADTDGGAHVDDELDETYMAVSRENATGNVIRDERDIPLPVHEGPQFAAVRQIAYEVIETLRKSNPELFD